MIPSSINGSLSFLDLLIPLSINSCLRFKGQCTWTLTSPKTLIFLIHSVRLDWTNPANSVVVTGSFDQWSQSAPLEKDDQGHFHANIALEKPDKISFKFIVDGKWETSPYYPSELDGSVLLINSGSLEQLCLCLPLMPNPLRLLFLLITLLLESLAAAGGSYEVSNHTLPCNYTAKDYKCDVMLGPNSYVSLNSIVFYAIVISVVDEPSNADAWKMMLQLPQLL